MIEINDRNQSFYSPQPLFIGAFFSMQQIAQIAWLYRLWKLDSKKPVERAELDEMVDYAPYFAVGNLCIGTWMIFWNSEQLKISNIFVIINSLSQLYYCFGKLRPMDTRSTTSVLTHVVAKTFAGIGVLDLIQNGSVAYFKDAPATMTVKVMTGLGFGLLSAASDWIFGGCMVYDLAALAVGQSGSWRNLLAVYAVGAAGIVAAKNLAMPPYNKVSSGYKQTATEDIQDRV
ncbi:hypothetical protein MMC28_007174 [Mycoblastus sanguinarius]|nr:hypothetical protein [Mycoblastus sanguinarius]